MFAGKDFPVTEPREREPEPTQGEPVQQQPEVPAEPQPGGWYPVEAPGQQPEAPADDEPTAALRARSAEAEEPTAVVDEPTVTRERETTAEPTAVVREESTVAQDRDVADEPTAVVAEEPTVTHDRATPDEPTADEPTAVVRESPTVASWDREPADVEPTVVAATPGSGPDDEHTTVQPRAAVPDERVPAEVEPTESIFRPPSPTPSPEPEPTRLEQLSEEERKLAEERAARREARAAALAATAPAAVAEPERVTVYKRTTDRFLGALGLFLLRLVVAAIFAVRGLNLLTDLPAAQEFFARTIIPEPAVAAMITGVACLLIALALVLGLLTRVAGLGVALIAGGALALVYWGNWSPFVPGQPGFLGELELLLTAVGLLFLLVGGGGWSLDRSFRAARQRDKAERSSLAD